jgi:hypothetical protein
MDRVDDRDFDASAGTPRHDEHGHLPRRRSHLVFYVLVPEDAVGRPAQPLSDPNLDLWNHELERLLLP